MRCRDDAGINRHQAFDSKADSDYFDTGMRRRHRRGTLVEPDPGTETLDECVAPTFAPVYVAPLAERTRKRYASLYDGHIAPTPGRYSCEVPRDLIGVLARRVVPASTPR